MRGTEIVSEPSDLPKKYKAFNDIFFLIEALFFKKNLCKIAINKSIAYRRKMMVKFNEGNFI